MILSPWLIVAALLLAIGGVGVGFKLGIDHEQASQKREDDHIAQAVDAALNVSADAISKITPKYTTIKGEVRREITTNTVYTDCRLPSAGVELVNRALDPALPASAPERLSIGRLQRINEALKPPAKPASAS